MIPHFTSSHHLGETDFPPEDYDFLDLFDQSVNSTRVYMLLLYSLIRSQGLKEVVEIGGFLGNTSQVLARGVRMNGGRLLIVEQDIQAATALFEKFVDQGHVRITVLDSKSVNFPITPDLVFIDGDHSYQGVQADWKIWSKKLKVGGYIAFHDAVTALGVNQFVHEMFPKEGWEHLGMPGDTGCLLVRKAA